MNVCVWQDMKPEWLRNQFEETKQEMHSTLSEVWVIMSDGRKRCRGKTHDEGILGTLASLALELGTKGSRFRDWPEQCCQDARAWNGVYAHVRSWRDKERRSGAAGWRHVSATNTSEGHTCIWSKRVFWMELFATLGAENDMKAKEWFKATHEELSFYGQKLKYR